MDVQEAKEQLNKIKDIYSFIFQKFKYLIIMGVIFTIILYNFSSKYSLFLFFFTIIFSFLLLIALLISIMFTGQKILQDYDISSMN